MSVIAAAFVFGMLADGLSDLEAKRIKAEDIKDPVRRDLIMQEVDTGVIGLIEGDKLTTAAEFRRASKLFAPVNGDVVPVQAGYELNLVAAAEGDKEAKVDLGKRWDVLLLAIGRHRRLGLTDMQMFESEKFAVVPTAPVVVAVYRDPEAAATKAKAGTSNPEIKKIVDADQAARNFDFSKVTTKQMEEMAKGDVARLARIKEIVASGALTTADDFDNAALVFQHGVVFEDYAMAHELSVCALLLGKRTASWLAGASYDRMLVNVGIPQRFATQYGNANGGPIKLQRYETRAINDTERKLIVRVTLEQAKNRKWN
ncbi:MAG: hypothetical protein JSS65_08540 [Armatimonadetes bacterium]|nr:hypothetical protein [Armatimonadota bacterium]